MINSRIKQKGMNALRAREERLKSLKAFNESNDPFKNSHKESSARLFGVKNTLRNNFIENCRESRERVIDNFADGLTTIVHEAYVFDSDKIEMVREKTRESVKGFIKELFNEDIISVADLENNPSMVVKIFTEECKKRLVDLDKNKPNEIERPIEENLEPSLKKSGKSDNEMTKSSEIEKPTETNMEPKLKDVKLEEDLNTFEGDESDDLVSSEDEEKKTSKAVKVISDTIKTKVLKNVKKNIEAAKEAKKKINEIKEAKDDALTEKIVNEEMEDFNIRKVEGIKPIHFQVITDLLNEAEDSILDDELDENDIVDDISDDDEFDDIDEIEDSDNEEDILMKVVASDAEYTFHEDVMDKVDEFNKTHREKILPSLKMPSFKSNNILGKFMHEAMNTVNSQVDILEQDQIFNEDNAICNAIVNYTILETLNTMNLIKNEEQRDAIVEKIMR